MIFLELDLEQANDLLAFIEDTVKLYPAGRIASSLEFVYGEIMPQYEEEVYR